VGEGLGIQAIDCGRSASNRAQSSVVDGISDCDAHRVNIRVEYANGTCDLPAAVRTRIMGDVHLIVERRSAACSVNDGLVDRFRYSPSECAREGWSCVLCYHRSL